MESATFQRIRDALAQGAVYVSEHAYDEALADAIDIIAMLGDVAAGEVIEDYPEDPRGASCLVLCSMDDDPVHSVWGYNADTKTAILVTVYRPDPAKWSEDYRARRPKK